MFTRQNLLKTSNEKKLNPKLNKKYCQDDRLDLRSNCLKTVTVILNVTSSKVIARPRGNHLKNSCLLDGI